MSYSEFSKEILQHLEEVSPLRQCENEESVTEGNQVGKTWPG